jgi:hypothetical protein
MASSEDSEVGTVHSAEVAPAAFFGRDDVRRMVTLGIVSRRECQNMRGAEFDAESATLAPLHSNGNEALGHEKPSR